MSRELQRAQRQSADAISKRFAELPTGRRVVATVATVTAGAASDGNALVTVSWRGDTYKVNGYAASYTPVVGHRVVCDHIDNQLIVAYRVIGQP